MIIADVVNSGAIPALEALAQFSGQRHRVIVGQIANLDTPDYRPADVSTTGFQRALGKAIDQRRGAGAGDGPLALRSTQEVEVGRGGRLTLRPATPTGNVLFHDRGNRDLERTMQSLAENVGVYRLATDLLRSRHESLRLAIRERTG
jgi:flagellar basal-body rod protein FlgB